MKKKNRIVLTVAVVVLLAALISVGVFQTVWNRRTDRSQSENSVSQTSLSDAEERAYEASEASDASSDVSGTEQGTDGPIAFSAKYIRTDGYTAGINYPVVTVIRSVEDLQAYYDTNKTRYALGRRTDTYGGEGIGFLDACDKYDAAYFEEQILILVVLEEGSGSIFHSVGNVSFHASDGSLRIDLDRLIPELGTDDMAEWHILIEPEAGIDVSDESDVLISLGNIDTNNRIQRYYDIVSLIRDGWEYEMLYEEDGSDFGIDLWPEGCSSAEGKLRLRCFSSFSVCGTGISEEKIVLGEYDAYLGTYQSNGMWDYIRLQGMPGTYVLFNDGANEWLDTYEDALMEFLTELENGIKCIHERRAIEIAETYCSVEYDQVRASYSFSDSIWTVYFYRDGVTGGGQQVLLGKAGNLMDTVYDK